MEHSVRDEALSMMNNNLIKSATGNQYITFSIGESEYGIDIILVQEIIRYSKPTTVYNSNPAIKGVTNFRGKVIPVIDMRIKFNLPEKENDEYTVIIIIEVNKKAMGLIVDRVSDIMSFKDEDVQAVDQDFAEDIKTKHVSSMAKAENKIIMLLDPDKIISANEIGEINEVS